MGLIYYIVRRPTARITRLFFILFQIPPMSLTFALSNQAVLSIIDWYLADFLWAYALTFALNSVALRFALNVCWIFTICIVSDCVMELLQGFCIVAGTFDFMDIFVQIMGTVIAQTQIYICLRKRDNYVAE